jgi:hypothetical protein
LGTHIGSQAQLGNEIDMNKKLTAGYTTWTDKEPFINYCKATAEEVTDLLLKIKHIEEENCHLWIYLYAFDMEGRLLWGNFIEPVNPYNYELMLSYVDLLTDKYGKENIYFQILIKKYSIFNLSDATEAYLNGVSDALGKMEMVKGFVKSWEDLKEKKVDVKPALKRFIEEFINMSLELPYRYSEIRRYIDRLSLKIDKYFSKN